MTESKSTIYVSVDSGNGYTNAVSGKLKGRIKKTAFPSVRADAPERVLGLDSEREVKYEVVEWFGNRYTYGSDTVRFSANAIERHHGSERYGDEFHAMMVALAMARMSVPGGNNIDLTLFMPPGLCTSNHKKHVIDSFSEGLSIFLGSKEYDWDFSNITIHPEGLGAILSFMLSPTGKPLKHDLFEGEILIVDSGTYTLDILRITDGKFDPASLETATHGNDGLYRHIISPLLAAIHRHDDDFKVVTADMLDRAIYNSHYDNGKCVVTSAGKDMSLTATLIDISKRYANWIVKHIFDTEYLGLQGIKSVIVVGGGAWLITPYLRADTLIGHKVLDYSKLAQLKSILPTELNAVGGQRWARYQMLQSK